MKNNELLKKYAGISTRIRRIFAYHYDQIQREVQTEISTLNPELQGQFMDLVVEYMEESINWPDPDDQETFEKHNAMKTIAYIMSTYHIGTHDLDIRDVLKSYIIARYYGWEPKEEDLEEIISNTPRRGCYLRSLNNAKRRNNHLKQRTYENIRKYSRS